MSIDYVNRVWQDRWLSGGALLVMLALAHHADAKGECWPGMPLLVEKTRLSDRQIRRLLSDLAHDETITIEQRAIGRGKKPHYRLYPHDKKADKMSDQETGKVEQMSTIAQESGQNVHLNHEKADISDNKSGHLLHGKADISDADYSHGRSESPLEQSTEQKLDEDDPRARDPIYAAWLEHYGEAITEKLETRISGLVAECGEAAVIFGIKASVEAKARNFKYIAQCARNYIPAASNNGHASGYHVELPGNYQMQATAQPVSPAMLPPPLATDAPWAICLRELAIELPSGFVPTLTDSYIEEVGMVNREDGRPVPLYRVLIAPMRASAGLNHFTKQAGVAIRRKLGSVLGYPVEVEIVAAEAEPSP